MSKFTKTGRVAKIYNCGDCGESFRQKSHYDKHRERKIPCILKDKPLKDVISETIATEINKKIKEINEETVVNNESNNNILNSDKKQIQNKFVVCDAILNSREVKLSAEKDNGMPEEMEDIIYENELKRIFKELKDDIYLYVFKNLEENEKFKKLYEDTINKIFQQFISMCERKVIKNEKKEEYKRDFYLFDNKNKIKSNDIVKNKLIEIFKDNEKYFNKRLLKYAKNLVAEIYDIKYIDIED